MLQRPIPIVVVIFAKIFSTAYYIHPRGTVKCHSHIMFTTDPRCYFHLKINNTDAQNLRSIVTHKMNNAGETCLT